MFCCDARYHELVKWFSTLKLVRLEFYEGIFGEENEDDTMEKHRYIIYQKKEETSSNLEYLVRF